MGQPVYIYGSESDRYLFRRCLRDEHDFKGFTGQRELMKKRELPDTEAFYIVHGQEEANLLISLGASEDKVIQFWDKGLTKGGAVILKNRRFLKTGAWARDFAAVLSDKKRAEGDGIRRCVRTIAKKDKAFLKEYHAGEKVVLAGDEQLCSEYAGVMPELVWGVLGEGDGGRSADDLLSEDMDGLIYVLLGRKNLRKLEGELIELGADPDRIFWNGIIPSKKVYSGIKAQDAIDPLIGYTRSEGPAPGFILFGRDDEKTEYRIVTLGGSTSDPTFENQKCWSEYIFEQLDKMYPGRVALYAGGEGGHVAAQECLKLMKDALLLEPDIVISYSGVNDTGRIDYSVPGHPFVRSFMPSVYRYLVEKKGMTNTFSGNIPIRTFSAGVEDTSSAGEQWVRCERLMRAMCQEFGVSFHAFLQPCSSFGKLFYSRRQQDFVDKFYRDASAMADRYEWLHDLTGLFEKDESVFFDICHVYEKGNRMIARAILPYINAAMRPDN